MHFSISARHGSYLLNDTYKICLFNMYVSVSASVYVAHCEAKALHLGGAVA